MASIFLPPAIAAKGFVDSAITVNVTATAALSTYGGAITPAVASLTSATTSSPDFNSKILTVIYFVFSLYYNIKKGIVKIPKSISNSIYLEVIFTSMMLWNYLTNMN